jgi:hypothetical protein
MIGISYYDFRANTSDRTTLLTDYWLARSSDAVNWQESQIAGPFDLTIAPMTTSPGAGGYFLGDYQGLLSVGTLFEPLFVQTNSSNSINPTDVFAAPAVSAGTAVVAKQIPLPGNSPAVFKVSADLRQRISETISNSMEQRIPGWRKMRLGNQSH